MMIWWSYPRSNDEYDLHLNLPFYGEDDEGDELDLPHHSGTAPPSCAASRRPSTGELDLLHYIGTVPPFSTRPSTDSKLDLSH